MPNTLFFDWCPVPADYVMPTEIPGLDEKISFERANKRLLEFTGRAEENAPSLSHLRVAARIDGFFVFALCWKNPPLQDERVGCVKAISHYIKEKIGHTHVENFHVRGEAKFMKRLISISPISLDQTITLDEIRKAAFSDEILKKLETSPTGPMKRKLNAVLFLRAKFLNIFDLACSYRRGMRENSQELRFLRLFTMPTVAKKRFADFASLSAFLGLMSIFVIYNTTADENGENLLITLNKWGTIYYSVNALFFCSIIYGSLSFIYHRKIVLALSRAKVYLHFGSALSNCTKALFPERDTARNPEDFASAVAILEETQSTDFRRISLIIGLCTFVAVFCQRFVNVLPEDADKELSLDEFRNILFLAIESII